MRNHFHIFGSTFITRVAALALGALAIASVGCADSEEDSRPEQQEEDFTAFPAMPSASDIPTEGSWALGMIGTACDLDRAFFNGAVGSATPVSDGVVYKATRSGGLIASAGASNKTIFAQKKCLSK
jgi:hypothetical protein